MCQSHLRETASHVYFEPLWQYRRQSPAQRKFPVVVSPDPLLVFWASSQCHEDWRWQISKADLVVSDNLEPAAVSVFIPYVTLCVHLFDGWGDFGAYLFVFFHSHVCIYSFKKNWDKVRQVLVIRSTFHWGSLGVSWVSPLAIGTRCYSTLLLTLSDSGAFFDFSLRANMSSDSIPQNSFGWQYKPRATWYTYAFHRLVHW